MKAETGKKVWIYGLHSARAVLLRRPREVREVWVMEEGRGPRSELLELASRLKVQVKRVSGRELNEVSGSDAHQGVAVSAPLPEYVELSAIMERPPHLILALDGITDPHNLGAMIRTAEALGASGVVIPKDRAAGLSTVAHKTSAGAVEWLPVCQVVNLSRGLREMKAAGYWIYGADAEGEVELRKADFGGKAVLVIGAEGKGLRQGTQKELDFRVRIPLSGKTRSLNAGVACAIIFSSIVQGRSGDRGPGPGPGR